MSDKDRKNYKRVLVLDMNPKDGRTHKLAITTGASTRLELGSDVNHVTVIAEVDCFIKFGNGSVLAVKPTVGTPADALILIGASVFKIGVGNNNIAAIAKNGNGDIWIVEMEEI